MVGTRMSPSTVRKKSGALYSNQLKGDLLKKPIEQGIKKKEAELVRLKEKIKTSNQASQDNSETATTDDNKEEPKAPVPPTSEEIAAKIVKTLKGLKGRFLLICIKGYPDPDNIAASLALQWMAQQEGVTAKIIYFEEISHHENRALVKKLDIEIEQFHDDMDLSRFDYFAVNDSQNMELPIKLNPTPKLAVFVDHHKTLGTVEGQFVDIREDAGSTSAIYAEYLYLSPYRFNGEDEVEEKIATALMHGIRSDTDNFISATPIDYRASEFLAPIVDRELLSLISRQSIPAKTMDLTQVALQRKDIKGNFMFSGVGYVRDEDRDGIGQSADYLLNREGIDTVIVYGIVAGGFVDGSLRTRSHVVDPDKWIKDVFGQGPDGNYYGGGRKDKGGFQIPLGVFAHCPDRDLLWILVKKTIDELFYAKIGVEDSSSDSD